MKKLAYIDHSFHKKSRATEFLVNILKKYYQVDIYWDDSWKKGPNVDLNEIRNKSYDIIIFFQMLYTPKELEGLNCGNIILIPMYDGVVGLSDAFWLQYRNVKFLNFSSHLHKNLLNLGLISSYFQFFLNPNNFKSVNNYNDLKGLFWQRIRRIYWDQIKTLISKSNFSKFHIHSAVDPGHEFYKPSEDELRERNITITTWFDNKNDYLEVLDKCNVFFCPRPYEGIGQSFIEAMAMGMCVVAPDNPTMNEYIENNETGFLYDPNNPQPIDFSNATAIGMNARKYIESGYEEWIAHKKEIIEFIETPYGMFSIPIQIEIKRNIRIVIIFIKRILFSTVSVIRSSFD